MIGHVDREFFDEELYDDYETAKACEERLAKKDRAEEIQAKNVALGKKVKEHAVPKSAKGGGEASFYRVTCKDNGRGMPNDDIPNMFERGLNLVQKEHRPADRDLIINEGSKLHFILDINIHRNIIHLHEKRDNKDKWHGAEI